jgi:cell division septation protein DedD
MCTQEMSDEGVHEIQLNGKQLVFMFMAVTVVAVVIFLCGVMVGRGVRAPRATEVAATAIETPNDPTALNQAATPGPPPESASSPSAPEASKEPLSYPDRLATTAPPTEVLKDPVTRPPLVETAVATAPAAPPVRQTNAKPSRPPQSEPASGGGYVVQVTAVTVRSEADAIAKRLQSKGFPSFVSSPSAGAARVYRVRIGKYTDRREAETVARRLEKEEQFKPWITR